ncbi:MAG TPA: hypothetical protein VNV85_18335, partial [Puia sp.]|nr:hypothetical protein [Puia sp.]
LIRIYPAQFVRGFLLKEISLKLLGCPHFNCKVPFGIVIWFDLDIRLTGNSGYSEALNGGSPHQLKKIAIQ